MDSQPVSYQRGPQRCTLVGGHTKPFDIEAGGDARDKHDSFVQRRRITKRRERTEDAVPADQGDLDVLASRELDDQGDDAAVRQVGALHRFIDLDEHQLVSEVDRLEMRTEKLEI